MALLLLESLRKHLDWWLESFHAGPEEGAPLSATRLIFLLLAFPLFLSAQVIHGICLILDEFLFPDFKEVEMGKPVFVLGIPRSGTTFLHRSLAQDSQFTSFQMWEALLAPSILQRRVLRAMGQIDRQFGGRIRKFVDHCIETTAGEFNDIHAVGLAAKEEDYLGLLPFGGCFILLLAFPFARELQQLGKLDEMAPADRQELIAAYKELLQRHLYCHPGKELLSKNAAFASWGPALREAFPEARFMICIREPISALSSQLSALTPARKSFGTDPSGIHTAQLFTDFYSHFYSSLSEFVAESDQQEVAVIEQQDLRTAPAGTIRSSTGRLRISVSDEIFTTFELPNSKTQSAHRHTPEDFSINIDQIRHCMGPHYEAMLVSENRSTPPSD